MRRQHWCVAIVGGMMESSVNVRLEMGETSSGDVAFAEAAATDDHNSRRAARRLRLLLDGGSLALFAIFLVRLLAVLLESDPLNVEWQAKFVDVLVNQGLIAFLGFVLIHLASFVQPAHDRLRRRLRLVRTLAVIPVIGYLLLIPLQITSSLGELSSAQAMKVKYLTQSSRLTELREAIQQSPSVSDLNVRLQSLLEPALSGDQLNQPLPQLRQNLLRANQEQQAQIERRLKENADGLDPYGTVVGRLGSSLGWALAFAAGAVPWGSRSTLIERLRRRR